MTRSPISLCQASSCLVRLTRHSADGETIPDLHQLCLLRLTPGRSASQNRAARSRRISPSVHAHSSAQLAPTSFSLPCMKTSAGRCRWQHRRRQWHGCLTAKLFSLFARSCSSTKRLRQPRPGSAKSTARPAKRLAFALDQREKRLHEVLSAKSQSQSQRKMDLALRDLLRHLLS